MPDNFWLHPFILFTGAAVFGLILSLWLMTLVILYIKRTGQRDRLEQRLGLQPILRGSPRVLRLWREGRSETLTVARMSYWTTLRFRMEQIREALGWQVPLTTMALGLVGLAGLGFLGMFVLTANVVPSALAGLVAFGVPLLIARRRLNRQVRLFESQLADAIALATRSLRAGHPLVGAFRLIVEEMERPVSTVFAEITQQQALGVPLDEALREAAARSPSPDMKLFAASMVIQLRSGGNLADMMERLADVIRDRIRLHRRARVLTAQVQLSKYVLLAVPPLLFLVLFLIRRNYIELLYATFPGRMALLAAAVLMLLGIWVMNRIATLRY